MDLALRGQRVRMVASGAARVVEVTSSRWKIAHAAALHLRTLLVLATLI